MIFPVFTGRSAYFQQMERTPSPAQWGDTDAARGNTPSSKRNINHTRRRNSSKQRLQKQAGWVIETLVTLFNCLLLFSNIQIDILKELSSKKNFWRNWVHSHCRVQGLSYSSVDSPKVPDVWWRGLQRLTFQIVLLICSISFQPPFK